MSVEIYSALVWILQVQLLLWSISSLFINLVICIWL